MKIRCRKWEKCWGDEKKKRGGGKGVEKCVEKKFTFYFFYNFSGVFFKENNNDK